MSGPLPLTSMLWKGKNMFDLSTYETVILFPQQQTLPDSLKQTILLEKEQLKWALANSVQLECLETEGAPSST